jgi:hypothetical protein
VGARETFSRSFKCPSCGKGGEATWEENSNPNHRQYAGRFDTILETITKGFQPTGGPDYEVACQRCGVPAARG